MKRVMSAHQPNFLPYLGFFHKMLNSDVFVIRDEVQFVERDWHHRNRIRVQGEDQDGQPKSNWLTVPVKKENIQIKDILIKTEAKYKNVPWNVYILRQIRSNYEKSPFFGRYFPKIEEIFLSKKERLIDLNLDLIIYLRESFEIGTKIVIASELDGYEKSGDPVLDLVELCKVTGANTYLSGPGGKNYLKSLAPFERNGIEVIFHEFVGATYAQRFPGFVPYLSSVDALFNVGGLPAQLRK
ncbi:MAG: WbqC family protein [Nitrospinota bacterium]